MALTNRTLILFKYFWETTDEAHPVSLADISAHLKEHGITADPRTLRSDIEQLVEFGVDIVKERRVQNLYHVTTRHFEAPEVKLLIDAVQSARFITPGKSKELVKRLTTFVAPGDAALLERHLYIDSRVKAVNESVYISVDRIQTAIAERRKIAFRYFDYSPAKEHESGRRRFTISHECAHYIMDRAVPSAAFHREFDIERIYSQEDFKNLFSFHETLIDRMGAALLMPRFMVRNVVAMHGFSEGIPVFGDSVMRTTDKLRIKQMANTMGVSFSAFLIRLRELGCLCYRPLAEYITEEMGLGQDGGAG